MYVIHHDYTMYAMLIMSPLPFVRNINAFHEFVFYATSRQLNSMSIANVC